jgi:LSD1 subclass zinc finger protein
VNERSESTDQRCSFCHRSRDEVVKVIAGPAACICNECVDVCNDILADDPQLSGSRTWLEVSAEKPALKVRCALCHVVKSIDEGDLVVNRAVLCGGCVRDVERTSAEKRKRSGDDNT